MPREKLILTVYTYQYDVLVMLTHIVNGVPLMMMPLMSDDPACIPEWRRLTKIGFGVYTSTEDSSNTRRIPFWAIPCTHHWPERGYELSRPKD